MVDGGHWFRVSVYVDVFNNMKYNLLLFLHAAHCSVLCILFYIKKSESCDMTTL